MKEKKEKLFVVNRCCMGLWDGPGTGPGTVHWFSHPIPEHEADALIAKWSDMNYRPTILECNDSGGIQNIKWKQEVKLINMRYVRKGEHIIPKNYADGKLRKITVPQGTFIWQIIEGVVKIFKNGTLVMTYRGDPHDRTPSGVRTIIREELTEG